MKILAYLANQPKNREALRDIALIRLAYDLSLRRGEICATNLADLRDDGLRVHRKGKTGKKLLASPKATRSALNAWIEVRGTFPGAIFINFDSVHRTKMGKRLTGSGLYEIVRRLGRQAGITGAIRPHGIRHTSISEARVAAARRGYGLDRLTDFSGHADVRTLKHYLDGDESVQGELAADIALP